MTTTLILASASPRRHELLRTIGLEFVVQAADVDESHRPGETPIDYVARVAKSKAMAVVGRMGAGAARPGVVVLAADTAVDVDGAVLGKPADDEEARRMLRLLSDRTHLVHTAVVGWRIAGIRSVTVTTEVSFAAMTESTIEWYLSIGEHLDKAGGYAMQGAGATLVSRIDGSPSNVIGLPLVETLDVLRDCGVSGLGG